jgi:hypothetical protein
MAWQKPLDADELRRLIKNDVTKLGIPRGGHRPVSFEESLPRSFDGISVLSDSGGYHFAYFHKGRATVRKATEALFEIRFWVVESLAFESAMRFERMLNIPKQDIRRLIHYKYLELLGNVGSNFKRRGEITVDESLRLRPYSS